MSDLDLENLLTAQLGRRVTGKEVAAAMGVSRSTYLRDKAGGLDAGQIIKVARQYDLSPTLMLIDMGVLAGSDVAKAAEAHGLDRFDEVEMLQELLGRAMRRDRLDRGVTDPSELGFTAENEAAIHDLLNEVTGQ